MILHNSPGSSILHQVPSCFSRYCQASLGCLRFHHNAIGFSLILQALPGFPRFLQNGPGYSIILKRSSRILQGTKKGFPRILQLPSGISQVAGGFPVRSIGFPMTHQVPPALLRSLQNCPSYFIVLLYNSLRVSSGSSRILHNFLDCSRSLHNSIGASITVQIFYSSGSSRFILGFPPRILLLMAQH